jgi:polysaccharide pyruvyl transferase WcaK-like protein
MVNSDQTWRKFTKNYLDYGFLRFAQFWKIKKFVYGASIGYDYWDFSPKEDIILKKLLTNFTGISVREKGSIKLIQEHLGITPEFVLDPTFLIDKQNYLNLIKDYKKNDNMIDDYIFIYTFGNIKKSESIIKKLYKELKLKKGQKTYDFNLKNNQTIEDFLYYISNCKAVVTHSFHGTIFSIIFNKPFITIANKGWAEERFKSLGKLLGIENRIIYYNKRYNISLLTTPLNINYSLIDELRIKSINFIKKNINT